MFILYLYVQTVTRQCFCFPNSQWGVTAHDSHSLGQIERLTFYRQVGAGPSTEGCSFFNNVLMDQGPFCGATDYPYFGLSCLHEVNLRVMSGATSAFPPIRMYTI